VESLVVVDHPLLKRDLTILRDRSTTHGQFRRVVADAAAILAYESMRDLQVSPETIETPLESTAGFRIVDDVIVVPILRAGLGMVEGFVRFLPEARIGHIGMYRDETTLQPVDYYRSVPAGDIGSALIYVVDPMLATGGSAVGAIDHLKELGGRRFRFATLVASPQGVETVTSRHPDVRIYAASLDRTLNDSGYILPGLGDAGDRIFGTGP
jgi:uracil phosphoribosyltransferase